MKKTSLLFFALLYILSVDAQNVFWASKVIKFSSQFGDKEFSAQQVLGPPNALPNYGKSLVVMMIAIIFKKIRKFRNLAI